MLTLSSDIPKTLLETRRQSKQVLPPLVKPRAFGGARGSSEPVKHAHAVRRRSRARGRPATAVAFRPVSRVGELREGALHAALKRRLAGPGDRLEVPVDGYVIDVVRGSGELVEVQTGSFSPLRAKLDALLDRHPMRIVHPV